MEKKTMQKCYEKEMQKCYEKRKPSHNKQKYMNTCHNKQLKNLFQFMAMNMNQQI